MGNQDARSKLPSRHDGALGPGLDRHQLDRRLDHGHVHGDDHEPGQHLRHGDTHDLERPLLWSDTTYGLQASVYRCNNCTTPANLVYSGALKNLAVPASGTIAAAGSDYLTFVFSLPTTAGNTFQTLTQDFTVTYTATQLSGTAR